MLEHKIFIEHNDMISRVITASATPPFLAAASKMSSLTYRRQFRHLSQSYSQEK